MKKLNRSQTAWTATAARKIEWTIKWNVVQKMSTTLSQYLHEYRKYTWEINGALTFKIIYLNLSQKYASDVASHVSMHSNESGKMKWACETVWWVNNLISCCSDVVWLFGWRTYPWRDWELADFGLKLWILTWHFFSMLS